MDTRALTIIKDEEGNDICRIYRQSDGYPEGHGIELARLCNVEIVNGIEQEKTGIANGMDDLAAKIVCELKKDSPLGGIYLISKDSFSVSYTYIVTGKVGEKPIIECDDGFKGTALDWLEKYEPKEQSPKLAMFLYKNFDRNFSRDWDDLPEDVQEWYIEKAETLTPKIKEILK